MVHTYSAAVLVTGADGTSDEALFGFVIAGPVELKWTKNTYADYFRKLTPDLPSDWEVHHTIQQHPVLANRYWKEQGINVHDPQYLRGVPKDVHHDVTNAQNAWWRKKAVELGLPGNDIAGAMQQVDLADYDEFVERHLRRGHGNSIIHNGQASIELVWLAAYFPVDGCSLMVESDKSVQSFKRVRSLGRWPFWPS